jgi:hypothetical protein
VIVNKSRFTLPRPIQHVRIDTPRCQGDGKAAEIHAPPFDAAYNHDRSNRSAISRMIPSGKGTSRGFNKD